VASVATTVLRLGFHRGAGLDENQCAGIRDKRAHRCIIFCKENATQRELQLMRILCLHGYTQNANVFYRQLSVLRKALKLRAELGALWREAKSLCVVFVSAPHVVTEMPQFLRREQDGEDIPIRGLHDITLGAYRETICALGGWPMTRAQIIAVSTRASRCSKP
jgi:hypothetical protein